MTCAARTVSAFIKRKRWRAELPRVARLWSAARDRRRRWLAGWRCALRQRSRLVGRDEILCVVTHLGKGPPPPRKELPVCDERGRDLTAAGSVTGAEDPPATAGGATALTQSHTAGQPPHYSSAFCPARRAAGLDFCSRETGTRFPSTRATAGAGGSPARRSGLALGTELSALLTTTKHQPSHYLSI